ALQPVLLVQCLLQRAQLSALCDRLDSRHLVPLHLHCEDQAGARRPAVDPHGAGAADAVLAADMRAGQMQVFAQRVGQQFARLGAKLVRLAVDAEPDRNFAHRFAPARSAASVIAPALSTSAKSRRNAALATVSSCGVTAAVIVRPSSAASSACPRNWSVTA